MVNEREKLIGARLRKYREMLQVPRSKFSVTIGFGTERVASYEAGRAPLRYEVFRAVTLHYRISPRWLATQIGIPALPAPFDDASLLGFIKPGALFSEVYDAHLAATLETNPLEAQFRLDMVEKKLSGALVEFWHDASFPSSEKEEAAKQLVAPFIGDLARVDRALRLRKKIRSYSTKKYDLTYASTSLKFADVKTQLPNLRERLNRATKETGKMSALADFLGKATGQRVPLASVSRWLSGKREPGGEVTLQMLRWVEQQERQK
jgi:transcriptional regulator with XRE-family HTH domain